MLLNGFLEIHMGVGNKLKSYPRSFWLANVMELFERGAYYGMNSILAIYLTRRVSEGGLGFSEESVGFLQAIVYALTYTMPILGGALAEKFGYRRILIAAFSILSFTYFATGHLSTYAMVFASLAFMAVGAGIFKPVISGTIARTTTEKNSSIGFGIYYWMINVGAFAGPVVVSVVKGFSWKYVFMASSLYSFLMLIPAVFFYRDPDLPGKGISLRKTVRNALIVLGDSRFMLMIFIYSFFWIIYFQNFGSVLWFMRDFIDRTPVNEVMNKIFWFHFELGEEMVTQISALTIIVFQVLISRLFKNVRAIPSMCTGMIIGSLGFLVLSFSQNAWFFILGLVVFSLGEMTAHPKYYSYVGIVAPQDRKAIYMGYAFLYGVIGSLFGSSIGALLYTKIAKPGNPKLFFQLFFLLGIVGVAGLLLYNRYFSEDTAQVNRRARWIVSAIYLLLILAGMYMLFQAFAGTGISWKMVAGSIILIFVGSGGWFVTRKYARENN